MSSELIDTNAFIYRFDETNERKRKIAEQLIRSALETRSTCISHQIVQETLNVVMRKFSFLMMLSVCWNRFWHPLWRVISSRLGGESTAPIG